MKLFQAVAVLASLAAARAQLVPIESNPTTPSLDVTALESKYIATALTTPEGCEKYRDVIQALQGFMDAGNAAARQGPARRINLGQACIVPFAGSEALKKEVEKLDLTVSVEQEAVGSITQAPRNWGLDRIDQPSLPLSETPYNTPWTGEGTHIYILDTGINAEHIVFQDRAFRGASFVNENSIDDLNGHGTHCSGTAGGTIIGIATKAKIFGVKVCTGQGRCPTAGIIDGVEWAINHAAQTNPRGKVMSLSLGVGPSTAMENAVRAAVNAGFIVTVASGNEQRDACYSAPASAGGSGPQGGVISVSSSTITDARSSFSNFGPECTDIYAPGSDILSAWIGSENAANSISGTSMATPHVAGVAAILLEKNNGNRNAAQAELFQIAAQGKITDARGTPNLLLQIPSSGGNPPGTRPPVPAPTPPPVPRGPPAGWTCSESWWNARDGCDCECGAIDPDCAIGGQRLFCGGRAPLSGEVCDFGSDTCRRPQQGTSANILVASEPVAYGDKVVEEEESGLSPVVIAGAAAGFAALVAFTAFVVVKRRNRASAEKQVAAPEAPVVIPDL